VISAANAAALIKGAAATPQKTVKVEVTRAFCIKGQRLEVGTAVEVPEALARELQSTGKAVPYTEKAAPAKPARAEEKK
jgi:hypothetical protein